MPDPRPRSAAPMAFWGTIQAAASEHVSAAALQSRISAEAERLGVTTSFETRQQITSIFTRAVQLREARTALAAAAPSTPIMAEHIAPLPYGLAPGLRGAARVFDVRVNYTAVTPTGPIADYITLRYTGGLPGSVGDLYAEAQIATSSLVEGYGNALTGLGEIEIGEL